MLTEQATPQSAESDSVSGQPPAPELTGREKQVALALARGAKNSEIAHDLDISIKTVDTHRAHVLKKLGHRNNVELALAYVRAGLVVP